MVTVEVVGGDTYEVDLDDVAAEPADHADASAEPTYADLCRLVGYSPHEVSVMVEDRPVPEDQPVEVDRVRILRLLRGG